MHPMPALSLRVEELGKIRQIGKTLAADIVTQIAQTNDPQKLEAMDSSYSM